MKHKVFYSSLALRDLDDIWEYITHELQNPRAAEQVATHIVGDIQQLEKFPKLGASLDSLSPVESNYRFLVVGNYIAFYRVEKEDIYIDRILYGRRNYTKILFEDVLNDGRSE